MSAKVTDSCPTTSGTPPGRILAVQREQAELEADEQEKG
jgi:hypothetical protein